MPFRNLFAITMLCLTASWVPLALADSERKPAIEQEPGAEEPKQNPREFLFEVVTKDGQPVPRATVTPWGVIANFGSFMLDKKRFPSVKTDEKGKVRVLFPKDPDGIAVKEDDNTGRLLRDLEQGILSQVALKIDHPDHPIWSQYLPVRAGKITLEDSVTVQIRAHTSDTVKFVRKNLYPILPFTFWQEVDWTEENGLLTIRRLDVTSKEAVRWLRITHVPDEGPVLFSDIVDLKAHDDNPMSLRLPLKPGVRVDGRLSENVPRPVKNGRLVGRIVTGRHPENWTWCATTEIAEDGTFVIESLPADENLQLVAVCDGWVTTSPTKEEVEAYVVEYGFTDPKYGGPMKTHVNPQLYRLSAPTLEPVLPMERTSACIVTVLDPDGKPIPDAFVGFWPNEFWFNWGSQIFGEGLDYLAKVRAQLASGDRSVSTDEVGWHSTYTAKTDARGMATISNLPPGGRDEPTVARSFRFHLWHDDYEAPGDPKDLNRMCSVEILPGESKAKTIKMTPKSR